MRPVLIAWHGIRIRSYPVMVYLATLAGSVVALLAARVRGLNLEQTAIAILPIVSCLMLGARALYVAFNWRIFRGDWRRIFHRSQGGMVFSGGLLAMLLCSPFILRLLQLPFAPFWDSAALGMLAGLPIAKVGCFLQGCCCGHKTDSWLGLHLPDHRGVWRRRIPVQLLEIAWSAALLGLLLGLVHGSPRPGLTFCLAVLGYSGPRVFFHALREEAATSRDLMGRAVLSAGVVLVAGCFVWLFS